MEATSSAEKQNVAVKGHKNHEPAHPTVCDSLPIGRPQYFLTLHLLDEVPIDKRV